MCVCVCTCAGGIGDGIIDGLSLGGVSAEEVGVTLPISIGAGGRLRGGVAGVLKADTCYNQQKKHLF